MARFHSLNNSARKRTRQVAALERWTKRVKHCGHMFQNAKTPELKQKWQDHLVTASEQYEILSKKL